jgi:hypothetical protein
VGVTTFIAGQAQERRTVQGKATHAILHSAVHHQKGLDKKMGYDILLKPVQGRMGTVRRKRQGCLFLTGERRPYFFSKF